MYGTYFFLQIGVVTTKDEGWYECQVNTEPKISNVSYLKIKSRPGMDNKNSDRGLQDAPQLQLVIPQIQEFLSNAVPRPQHQHEISGAVNGPRTTHRRKNVNDAFNSITLNRVDQQPVALPQLETRANDATDGVDADSEKYLFHRVASLEERVAKLEERLGIYKNLFRV